MPSNKNKIPPVPSKTEDVSLEKIKDVNSRKCSMMQGYYEDMYKNFNSPEIQSRIIEIEILLQYIQDESGRNFYKLYLKPVSGLPQIIIKNPASFFVLCTIHGFFPNISSIVVQDSGKKINLLDYQNLISFSKMLQLFFYKGFDFVLYDMINKFVQEPAIKNLFKEGGLLTLNEAEVMTVSKVISDIKQVAINNHQLHFSNGLGKLSNDGAFSENVFLEMGVKYENKIREVIGYKGTYIKPAPYIDDERHKTDFNRISSIRSNDEKYRDIPIQFTSSLDAKQQKKQGIVEFFKSSGLKEFIYLKVNGSFRKNLKKIKERYIQRIQEPSKREEQDITTFPLFVNHNPENLDELVILYFYLHQIIKKIDLTIQESEDQGFTSKDIEKGLKNRRIQRNCEKIDKLGCVIGNIDFQEVEIEGEKHAFGHRSITGFKYVISRNGNIVGEIFYMKKVRQGEYIDSDIPSPRPKKSRGKDKQNLKSDQSQTLQETEQISKKSNKNQSKNNSSTNKKQNSKKSRRTDSEEDEYSAFYIKNRDRNNNKKNNRQNNRKKSSRNNKS